MSKRMSMAVKTGDRLDMQKLTLALWEHRGDKDVVEELSESLLKRHSSKQVFKDVEFFLPQLVHMILHLEVEWNSSVLQEFCLMVSQVSLHFALQVYWILVGALQDSQPELENGQPNPKADTKLFLRCIDLLASIERAVVYGGGNEVLSELERDYAKGLITRAELDAQLKKLRLEHARELVTYCKDEEETLSGPLLYKRFTKKSKLSTKGWKERRFAIRNRILLCYRVSDGVLKRAIPLANCEITVKPHRTHDFFFEVREFSHSDRIFYLAADNETTRDKWLGELRKAAAAPPLYKSASAASRGALDGQLTPTQELRHKWFKAEADFVFKLTAVAEELRFRNPNDRTTVLGRRMLEMKKRFRELGPEIDLYNPLCHSTDMFLKITDTDHKKVKAFTTKARCPCLVTFCVERQENGEDVANHLQNRYSDHPEGSAVDKAFSALPAALSRQVSKPSMWQDEEDIVDSLRTPADKQTQITQLIAKSNDDLRQEVYVMQLLQFMLDAWQDENLDLWMFPYKILSTSASCGLIELIKESDSLHGVKSDYLEKTGANVTLKQHFEREFNGENTEEYKRAVSNFTESLAGYSVACFLLGIKDRHNGNIMLRKDGRIIHIDFGFAFSMAPGKNKVGTTNFSLERAPFKLTNEMVELMGSEYERFPTLVYQGLSAMRKHWKTLKGLVEITAFKSNFPCFNQPGGSKLVLKELEDRMMLGLSEDALEAKAAALVKTSKQHKGTIMYEIFQRKSNGIRPIF